MISREYLGDNSVNNKEVLLAHCMQIDRHIDHSKNKYGKIKIRCVGMTYFSLLRKQASKPFTIEATALINS
jgi:hypothetical protein